MGGGFSKDLAGTSGFWNLMALAKGASLRREEDRDGLLTSGSMNNDQGALLAVHSMKLVRYI